MAGIRVAVVGATGLVGRTILQVLEQRAFPVSVIKVLASPRSAGTQITFQGTQLDVEVLTDAGVRDHDLVFFAAGSDVSRRFAPVAAESASLVVDNSAAFRMDPDVPLIVPEVNGHLISGSNPYRGIVANPNCSTIQMVVALHPLHIRWCLESVVVSTYQSVSGSGAKGIAALDYEVAEGRYRAASPYPHPIAFNALPHIADFDDTGWSGEEHKMIDETRKIMNLPEVQVIPTTVRVPVRVSHSESIYARFLHPLHPDQVRVVLQAAAGVVVEDAPETNHYPLPLRAEGSDDVFVGRIRQIPGDTQAVALWVVSDNVRKGAATNAVQIAELFVRADELTGSGAQYV